MLEDDLEALLIDPLLGGVDYEEVEDDPDLLDEPVLQLDMQVCVWCGVQLACVWCGVQLASVWCGVQLACVWCGVQLASVWCGVQLACVWCN